MNVKLIFKAGDQVRLKPGRKNSKFPVLGTGVTVKDVQMFKRTAAFTCVEIQEEKWWRMDAFEKIGEVAVKDLKSEWHDLSEEQRKEFVRKIVVKLYSDFLLYDKIDKLLNT